MKEGLPKPVVWGAAVLFVLSVVSIVVALIYFVSQPVPVPERINPELSDVIRLLRVATVLLVGTCVSSLVLAIHFRRLGAYTITEETIFFICFALSLCCALLTGIPVVAASFV